MAVAVTILVLPASGIFLEEVQVLIAQILRARVYATAQFLDKIDLLS